MPEQMTKQDAIEYLLYMKHDVQAKSPMDIALDTAIEALKQPTIEPEARHGRWIRNATSEGYHCSNCGHHVDSPIDEMIDPRDYKYFLDKYCGGCGARMDGGADNG